MWGGIDKLNISSADVRRSGLNVLQDSQNFAQGLAEFEQHVQDTLLHDGCVWLWVCCSFHPLTAVLSDCVLAWRTGMEIPMHFTQPEKLQS